VRLRSIGIVTALGLIAVLSLAGTAVAGHPHHGHHGGRPLFAALSGANEAPFVGDPDGSGGARLRLNPGHGEICFSIRVAGITLPATAANLYQGSAGISGAFVASLLPPTTTGGSRGCAVVSRDTLEAIMRNTSAYYVNVFTYDYPNGAVRGQLSKGWGTGDTTTNRTFSANLKGVNESPLPGDPDGRGFATITVSATQKQICFDIRVSEIWLPAVSAYLGQGPPGTAGPIVATFTAPSASGVSSGCAVGLTAGVVSGILANPSGYYVNVTTYDYPSGAIRGQLSGSGNGCGHDDDDDHDGHDDLALRHHPGWGDGCGHGGGHDEDDDD
jgi:hypothetical protein